MPTCSFFLAAASNALEAADLKLFVEVLLLWMELVLALCFKPCEVAECWDDANES